MALITAIKCAAAPIPQGAHAAAVDLTEAALAQHVTQLAKQAPEGFTLVVQPPFVALDHQRSPFGRLFPSYQHQTAGFA